MGKSLSECRNEAIKKRDATVAIINERYDAERRKEDRLFDAEFDRVRDEFERIRKKTAPRSCDGKSS